jgi:hypothetical protein
MNADGLSEHAFLRVELIDRKGDSVAGYSGSAAALVKEPGLKVKVAWPGGPGIQCANAAYRVRVTFGGARAAEAKFYAAYLE